MPTDKARVAELQARHRHRNFELLLAYLVENPCVDCGEDDPIVLDFDHLPGVQKRFEIGRAMSGSTRSWTSILEEISKCEVVCANCHRRRTAARGGFRKYVLSTGSTVTLAPLEPRPGRRVGHGEGAKGQRGCKCELCVSRSRAYHAARRSR